MAATRLFAQPSLPCVSWSIPNTANSYHYRKSIFYTLLFFLPFFECPRQDFGQIFCCCREWMECSCQSVDLYRLVLFLVWEWHWRNISHSLEHGAIWPLFFVMQSVTCLYIPSHCPPVDDIGSFDGKSFCCVSLSQSTQILFDVSLSDMFDNLKSPDLLISWMCESLLTVTQVSNSAVPFCCWLRY